ncbi:hypothetical protein KEM52_004280, partial [Ascosphaera acerosa]
VSDALLKLKPRSHKHRAGYLADLRPITPSSSKPVVGLASTFKFVAKTAEPDVEYGPDQLIPKTSHWADCVKPDTVVVIEQPGEQHCAAVGGIMASRMAMLGARGVIVDGRVRDAAELEASKLSGDVIYLDPLEGAVVIQQDLLDEALALMPQLVAADDKVKEAVLEGMPVYDAFQRFRD